MDNKVVVPICVNMNLSDSMFRQIIDHGNGWYHLDVGTHKIDFYAARDDMFYVEYDLYWQDEEYSYCHYYEDSLTGLYNAVWEFLCTLDKWCTEDGYRRLGSAFEAGFPH